MVDPRRLLTFREVAHRGSFSRAAEALALTQPAVSQQVAALERADAVAERLALATTQLADRAGAGRRRLRLGAFSSALATLVPGAVAALRAAEPQVEVDAVEASNEGLLADVRAGALHA